MFILIVFVIHGFLWNKQLFIQRKSKLEVLVCNDILKIFSFKSRQHKIWVLVTVKIFYDHLLLFSLISFTLPAYRLKCIIFAIKHKVIMPSPFYHRFLAAWSTGMSFRNHLLHSGSSVSQKAKSVSCSCPASALWAIRRSS